MTPLPAAPVRRPMWGRVLIGCAIVGGFFVVAGIAVFFFGMYWLTSAGRHYPTTAVASPQSHGVVRVGDLAADPGARALLTGLFRRMQDAGQRHGQVPMPGWIRNLQAQQARQGISQWLPREATISLEPDDEDVPRIVIAANMRGFVQPIRFAVTQGMKNDPKASITHHGDREILNVSKEVAICFMDGTLVVSYHPSAMEPALDRLGAAGASPSPGDDRALPGRWDVSGWLDEMTGTGMLVGLLSPPDDPQPAEGHPLEGLRTVRFGIDVESEDDARIVAEVAFDDADGAAAGQPWLAEGVSRLRERMASSGLASTATDSVDGDHVRCELKLSGLESSFSRWIERQDREHRRPER